MKILITVDGDKMSVEINSQQLELPFESPPPATDTTEPTPKEPIPMPSFTLPKKDLVGPELDDMQPDPNMSVPNFDPKPRKPLELHAKDCERCGRPYTPSNNRQKYCLRTGCKKPDTGGQQADNAPISVITKKPFNPAGPSSNVSYDSRRRPITTHTTETRPERSAEPEDKPTWSPSPKVPGTPDYGKATRDDAEAGRRPRKTREEQP